MKRNLAFVLVGIFSLAVVIVIQCTWADTDYSCGRDTYGGISDWGFSSFNVDQFYLHDLLLKGYRASVSYI